jgi:predicted nucleic acid-binding protein
MAAITDLVERVAMLVEAPLDHRFALDDPDDEVYLATALAGRAEILITGDLRHFPERHYGPIGILSPAEFLAWHGG